jgi:hypothetical protein
MANTVIEVDGYAAKSKADNVAYVNSVSSGYFETLRIPLLAGRDFDARDTANTMCVAIVNETLARKFFGTLNVVGRRFRDTQFRNNMLVKVPTEIIDGGGHVVPGGVPTEWSDAISNQRREQPHRLPGAVVAASLRHQGHRAYNGVER